MPADTAEIPARSVEPLIAEIRAHMPGVYQAIRARADAQGAGAFALVRRGLRGEPGCFYAFEGGRVMGTPFAVPGVMAEVAQRMVEFGVQHVCIWPEGG